LMHEVPQVNKDSTPITVFLIFFMEVIWLLVADANKYCKRYLGTLQSQWMLITSWHDCTEEVCNFGYNMTNGPWCQRHTETLLVHSLTVLYDNLQYHCQR
jgi:hypothetical protein